MIFVWNSIAFIENGSMFHVRYSLVMIVFADSKKDAEKEFILHRRWMTENYASIDQNLVPLINRLYGDKPVFRNESRIQGRWSYAFYVRRAPSSQFDLLVKSSHQNSAIPDGVLCVAGSGHLFHGQRERPWSALDGNIHLSIYLSPSKKISHYYAGLPVLSAVSLVQTIDDVEGLQGQARIKWVNDVLIREKKVAGFLVHTQSVKTTVTAIILGIGLNVEKTPSLSPDGFTPKAGSLSEFLPSRSTLTRKKILKRLLESLDKNYGLLCGGQYQKLLDFYRKRSAVIGREVQIISDIPGEKRTVISSGTVEKIGDNLELWLKGQKTPVTEGRLVLT
jgi:biotin-[acetyl-CoA-carboxylase] ligase BirA-like protein